MKDMSTKKALPGLGPLTDQKAPQGGTDATADAEALAKKIVAKLAEKGKKEK